MLWKEAALRARFRRQPSGKKKESGTIKVRFFFSPSETLTRHFVQYSRVSLATGKKSFMGLKCRFAHVLLHGLQEGGGVGGGRGEED